MHLQPITLDRVRLAPSLFAERFSANRAYLLSLRAENLLQNFYLEAGLADTHDLIEDCHGGWEAPTCQLRGHFVGHWLSAMARAFAASGEDVLRATADHVVSELARCQQLNGNGWIGSTPEKYLHWLAAGRALWAPQYTHHKTGMGLFEMYAIGGNQQALDILVQWADWYLRWTDAFSREQLDDILDVETGGMMELWADLFGATGDPRHQQLMERYARPRLFDPLLRGEDPLTNQHANTTIPEAHGAARAYEVTRDERWRQIAEAYWRCAVTERGMFCTGSQTHGEIWTPPQQLAARLGDKNQEHCVVYNMMRLADYLFRWSGDVAYADYRELNIYNGILAQQHPKSAMVSYFLPLEAGGCKTWSTPTRSFFCCNGSAVQAHASHGEGVGYVADDGLVVAQYIPATLTAEFDGVPIILTIRSDPQVDHARHPRSVAWEIDVSAQRDVEFTLALRVPGWTAATPEISVGGERAVLENVPPTFCRLRRRWRHDTVRLVFPTRLQAVSLPDDPQLAAFVEGPVVLAGLCDADRPLVGDAQRPETILRPIRERQWRLWKTAYQTCDGGPGIRFVPLHEIDNQRYTVYFPFRAATAQ